MSEKRYNCKQVADILGVTESDVRRWKNFGLIKAKTNGGWLYTEEELEAAREGLKSGFLRTD